MWKRKISQLLSSCLIVLVLFCYLFGDFKPQEYVIYVDQRGRLGNILFPFASTWALGKRTGRPVKYAPGYTELQGIFPSLQIETVPQWRIYWAYIWHKHLTENGSYAYMDEWIRDPPSEETIVCCYMQSFKYFEPFERELFDTLQFHPRLQSHALARYTQVKSELNSNIKESAPDGSIIMVAIHVRRGDLVDNKKLYALGRRIATLSYINKAKKYYKDKFKNVHFLVFSDSYDWCNKNLQAEDTHIMNGASRAEDMALMAMCQHFIMTVGTFGWWNAWMVHMNGGEVVYYNNSYSPTGYIKYKVENFMKSNWIPLSD